MAATIIDTVEERAPRILRRKHDNGWTASVLVLESPTGTWYAAYTSLPFAGQSLKKRRFRAVEDAQRAADAVTCSSRAACSCSAWTT
jgi:hypothetical protein